MDARRLPPIHTLQYINALLTSTLLLVGVLYVLIVVVRDPRNIGRIGRKQFGA